MYPIETSTPDGVMAPIGAHDRVARAGHIITVGSIAGVDPDTGSWPAPKSHHRPGRSLDPST
jgi:hypothetical protein